jgi:hypothetical protein
MKYANESTAINDWYEALLYSDKWIFAESDSTVSKMSEKPQKIENIQWRENGNLYENQWEKIQSVKWLSIEES